MRQPFMQFAERRTPTMLPLASPNSRARFQNLDFPFRTSKMPEDHHKSRSASSKLLTPGINERNTMAKPVSQKIKLLSTAGTGFFYVTKKNPRTSTEKIVFKKYDPVARKHVSFKETKIK